jgi:hypothetical protein
MIIMSKTPEQTAEEAIRWIKTLPPASARCNQCACEGYRAGYQAAQQWISVKDRLPEEKQDVLVWYHGSYDVAYLQKVKPVKLQPPQFNNIEMFEWCFYDFEDVDVTHWMPLPAAPKEEE